MNPTDERQLTENDSRKKTGRFAVDRVSIDVIPSTVCPSD